MTECEQIPCKTKFYLTAQEMLDLLKYMNPVLDDNCWRKYLQGEVSK